MAVALVLGMTGCNPNSKDSTEKSGDTEVSVSETTESKEDSKEIPASSESAETSESESETDPTITYTPMNLPFEIKHNLESLDFRISRMAESYCVLVGEKPEPKAGVVSTVFLFDSDNNYFSNYPATADFIEDLSLKN